MGRGFSGADKSAGGGIGTRIMVSMGIILLLVTLLTGFCLYTFLAQLSAGRTPSPPTAASDPAVGKLAILLNDLRTQDQQFAREQTPASVVQFDDIGKNLLAEGLAMEKRGKQSNDPTGAQAGAQVGQLAAKYLAAFRELVQAWEVKGVTEGNGIRQKLRQAAQNIAPLANPGNSSQVLQEALTRLVRAEQNYFAARSGENRRLLAAAATDMTGAVSASGLDAAAQEVLRNSLRDYTIAFDRYQAVSLESSDPALSAAFAAAQVKQEKAMHQAVQEIQAQIAGQNPGGQPGTVQEPGREAQEYLLHPDAGHAEQVKAALAEYDVRLEAAPLSPQQKEAMKKAVAAYRDAFAALVAQDKIIAAAATQVNTAFSALQNQISALVKKSAPPARAKVSLPSLPPQTSLFIIAGGWLFILVLGLLLARLLAGAIRKPLLRMTDTARRLAVQDATGQGFLPEKNEFAVLADALNELMRSQPARVSCREAAAEGLPEKTEDLVLLVRQKIDQDDRAIDLADRLQKVLSSFRATIDRTRRASEELLSATCRTPLENRQGQETAAACARSVAAAAESLQSLTLAGTRLHATITAHADLAEQTSVTALNAAIKAGRAGIHGKEFSEVTAELDRLAKRSGETAREIDQLLTTLHDGLAASKSHGEQACQILEQVAMAADAPQESGAAEKLAALQAGTADSAALLDELGDISGQFTSLLEDLAQLNQEVEVALLRVEPAPQEAEAPSASAPPVQDERS